MKGPAHDKLWNQLEAEIHLHRHKTVIRACRGRNDLKRPMHAPPGHVCLLFCCFSLSLALSLITSPLHLKKFYQYLKPLFKSELNLFKMGTYLKFQQPIQLFTVLLMPENDISEDSELLLANACCFGSYFRIFLNLDQACLQIF